MRIPSLILCITCITLFFTLFENRLCHAKQVDSTTAEDNIVYSSRPIKKGKVFEKSDLEARKIKQFKVGQLDIFSVDSLLERRSSRSIAKGDRLSVRDIHKQDLNKWTSHDEQAAQRQPKAGYGKVVVPCRDLFKGSPVCLWDVVYAEVPISKIPHDAVITKKAVIGKTTTKTIEILVPILVTDLE